MFIDVNVHWLPESLFTDRSFMNRCMRCVPRGYGEHVEVTTLPGSDKKDIVLSKPKGFANVHSTAARTDMDACLKDMDKAKIDKAVLRMCIWPEWIDLDTCKMVNDSMAKTVSKHPDRFLGLATVPPWGDEDCLSEVDRCINDLGFCGVGLAAHYGNLYLDEEEFRPYFKKLNKMGVPICVHHTPLPADYQSIYKYTNLRYEYGRSITQGTAIGRELFSGMFDEFPNLKLIHTQLGGGFFTYINVWLPQKSEFKDDTERFDTSQFDKIRGYLDRNIYVDITHAHPWGKAQLECAVKVLGADHILFGSSWAVRREWMLNGVEFVQRLDISDREKSLILGENAMKLFNIKA